MSFITSKPDLSSTLYSERDLEVARLGLLQIFSRCSPHWIRDPRGPIGKRWGDMKPHVATYNACYLIELYRILSTLERRLKRRSRCILSQKLRQLLEIKDESQFDETLAELQVADLLLEKLPSLEFEPLSGDDPSNPKSSPDLSSKLGTEIFIEVTTFKFAILHEWDRTTRDIANQLFRELRRCGKDPALSLQLPLSVARNPLPNETLTELKARISSGDNGTFVINRPDGNGEIAWHTPPKETHVDPNGESVATYPSLGMRVRGSNPSISRFQMLRQIWPEDAAELVHKSLANLLKRKRNQFPVDAPYVLCIRAGHHALPADLVVKVIHERLWPNPMFAWLSAVALFTPRTLFDKKSPGPTADFFCNPKSTNPLTVEFLDFLSGRRVLVSNTLPAAELIGLKLRESRPS